MSINVDELKSWIGNDEIVFDSTGYKINTISLTRFPFKEYHTDQDNLNYVTEEGLRNSFQVLKNIIDTLENKNFYPKNKFLCEPNLGKRGLMSTIGKKFYQKGKSIKNFLVYADGKRNLFEISKKIKLNLDDTIKISEKLYENKLI